MRKYLRKTAIAAVAVFEKLRVVIEMKPAKKIPHMSLNKLPQPELSESEKRDIDAFWAKYGLKIKDYSWFRMYYGITGIKNPAFIPQEIQFYSLLPHYNFGTFIKAWRDKNVFDRLLPKAHFPKTIIKKCNGRYYDGEGNFVSAHEKEKLKNLLFDAKQVIVKNTQITGLGKSVTKYTFNKLEDTEKLLNEWDNNFLVQEVIHQHRFFAQFNDTSVNIMRLYTWFCDGEVHVLCPIIRFGLPGAVTDISFVDGEEVARFVGITPDGHLHKEVIGTNGEKQSVADFVKDVDEPVPFWDEIVQMIKNQALQLPYFNLVGWDVTVDESGKPVIIEYNINKPGSVFPQMAHGPFYGEYSEQALAFLKDKKNQKKYLPLGMRA